MRMDVKLFVMPLDLDRALKLRGASSADVNHPSQQAAALQRCDDQRATRLDAGGTK